MPVVSLIFTYNNDQDVIKQRLNVKNRVNSSLKYCISQFMAENEVKFWPGGPSRAPRKMNTWFYFPPMAIHYSLSEGIHFYIQNFLPPTPWIPQTIHFGRLFILRVIRFERDHCTHTNQTGLYMHMYIFDHYLILRDKITLSTRYTMYVAYTCNLEPLSDQFHATERLANNSIGI